MIVIETVLMLSMWHDPSSWARILVSSGLPLLPRLLLAEVKKVKSNKPGNGDDGATPGEGPTPKAKAASKSKAKAKAKRQAKQPAQ